MTHFSRNFDIRSGQYCDLSIVRQWEKNEKRLFWTKTIRNTLKHRVTGRVDTLGRNISTSDPRHQTPMPFQVISRHQQFFGNNF